MRELNLVTIPNNEAGWMAIALAIPSFFIVLIGTAPLMQGLFYLVYTVGFWYLWQHRGVDRYSSQFMFFGILFLVTWIAPNIITKTSGRLESEMLSLPVLIYHGFMLPLMLLWFRSWTLRSQQPGADLQSFCKTLLVLLTPLVALILIESLRLKIQLPDHRPDPFNYRHLTGEGLLMFLLVGLAVPGRFIKGMVVVTTIVSLILIENRGGLLSTAIILGLFTSNKMIQCMGYKRVLIALLASGVIVFVCWPIVYRLLDYFFLLEDSARGLGTGLTQRMPIWIDTWQEIQRVPWTGVGFWVSPYPYGEVAADTQVHNAFLRLWVENGSALFIFITGVLLTAAIQIERKGLHWHRMALISILAYYFFIPRHLTLNPLSILLYLTIMQALCLPMKKQRNQSNRTQVSPVGGTKRNKEPR